MKRLGAACLAVLVAGLAAGDSPAQSNSLLGVWEGTVSLNGLPVLSDATLRADGSFSLQATSDPGLSFDLSGTYTVMPAQQTIRFVNRRWYPGEECLPGLDFQMHCTRIDVPQTTDVRYRFLSPDAIVAETQSLSVGPVEFRRIR
jgi:hypothetical protein